LNKVETKKIMAILWAAYPGFYAKAGDMDKDAAVKLWQECFEEEPYDLVSAAVYALIKTRPNSFPPTIGEVTAQIQRLTKPDEMTELEAWNLVAKALRNSFYGAAEEFAKLPPIVQRLVGAPAQLKEWAAMDTKTVQSVVASNFQRSYQTRVKSDKEFQALPPAIREFVTSLTSGDNPAIKRLED
jgi:hypothetical protein